MADEVRYWYERGYDAFYFSDSNFALDKARVRRFCQIIQESSLKLSFVADGLRADHIDRELLKEMKCAGFTALTFGAESGSNKVLKNLKKGESRETIESAIAAAVDLGFKVTLFFLIGSPGEEPEDIEQSFELARKYDVVRVYFFNLTPIPGTEFFDWATARGYWDELDRRYPETNFGFSDGALLRTDVMTTDQLDRYIRLARRVELQASYKHFLTRLLSISGVRRFIAANSFLSALSWFASHPIVAPVFGSVVRCASICKGTLQAWR